MGNFEDWMYGNSKDYSYNPNKTYGSGGNSSSAVNGYAGVSAYKNPEQVEAPQVDDNSFQPDDKKMLRHYEREAERAANPEYIDTWDSSNESYSGYSFKFDAGTDKKGTHYEYTVNGDALDFMKAAHKATWDGSYEPDDDDQMRKNLGLCPRKYAQNYTSSGADQFLMSEGLPSLAYFPHYLNMYNEYKTEENDRNQQINGIASLDQGVATKLLGDYVNGVRPDSNVYIDSTGAFVREGTEGATAYSYRGYVAKTFYEMLDSDEFSGLKRWYTPNATAVNPSKYTDSKTGEFDLIGYNEAGIANWQKEFKNAQSIEEAQETAINKGQAGKDTNYTKSEYMYFMNPSFNFDDFYGWYMDDVLQPWLESKILTDAGDIALVGGDTMEDYLNYVDRQDYLKSVSGNFNDSKTAVNWVNANLDSGDERYSADPFQMIVDMRDTGASDAVIDKSISALSKRLKKDKNVSAAERDLETADIDLSKRTLVSAQDMSDAGWSDFAGKSGGTFSYTRIYESGDGRFVVMTPINPKATTAIEKKKDAKVISPDALERQAKEYFNGSYPAQKYVLKEFNNREDAEKYQVSIDEASAKYMPVREIEEYNGDKPGFWDYVLGAPAVGIVKLGQKQAEQYPITPESWDEYKGLLQAYEKAETPEEQALLEEQIHAKRDEMGVPRDMRLTTASGRSQFVKEYVISPYNTDAASVTKWDFIVGKLSDILFGTGEGNLGLGALDIASAMMNPMQWGSVMAKAEYNLLTGNKVIPKKSNYAKLLDFTGELHGMGVSPSMVQKVYDSFDLPTDAETDAKIRDQYTSYIAKGREELVNKQGVMNNYEYDQAIRNNGYGAAIPSAVAARNYFVDGTGQYTAEQWDALTLDQKMEHIAFWEKNWMSMPDVSKSVYDEFLNMYMRTSFEGLTERITNDAVNAVDWLATAVGFDGHKFADSVNGNFNQYWNYGVDTTDLSGKAFNLVGTVASEAERMFVEHQLGSSIVSGITSTPAGAFVETLSTMKLADVPGIQKAGVALAKAGLYWAQSLPFIASATGSYFAEAKMGGASNSDAVAYAGILGAFEGLVEALNADKFFTKLLGMDQLAVDIFKNRGSDDIVRGLLTRAKLVNLGCSVLGETFEEGLGYIGSWGMGNIQGWNEQGFSFKELTTEGLTGGLIGGFCSLLGLSGINANDVMQQSWNAVCDFIIQNPNEVTTEIRDIMLSQTIAANMSETERAKFAKMGYEAILTKTAYDGLMTDIRNQRKAIDKANSIEQEMQAVQARAQKAKGSLTRSKGLVTSAQKAVDTSTGSAKTEALAKLNKALANRAEKQGEYDTAIARLQEVEHQKTEKADVTIANAEAQIKADYDKIKAHHLNMAIAFDNAPKVMAKYTDAKAKIRQNAEASYKSKTEIDNMLATGEYTVEQYDEAMLNLANSREEFENNVRQLQTAQADLQNTREEMRDLYAGNKLASQQGETTQAQEQAQEQQTQEVQQEQTVEAQEQSEPAQAGQAQAEITTEETDVQPQAQEQVQAEAQIEEQTQAKEAEPVERRPATEAEINFVNGIASRLGVQVVWDVTGDVNGYYSRSTRVIHLNPNIEAGENGINSPVMIIFKHELTHSLANSKYWDELANYVMSYARMQYKGGNKMTFEASRDNFYKNISAIYGDQYTDAIGVEEFVADWVMKNLFKDQDKMDQFIRTNSELGARMLYKLQHMMAQVNLRKSGDTAAMLMENIEYMYAKAFKNAGVQPSVGMNGSSVVRLSANDNIFSSMMNTERGKEALSAISEKERNEFFNQKKKVTLKFDKARDNKVLLGFCESLYNTLSNASAVVDDIYTRVDNGTASEGWANFATFLNDHQVDAATTAMEGVEPVVMKDETAFDSFEIKENVYNGRFMSYADVLEYLGISAGEVKYLEVLNAIYNDKYKNGSLTDASLKEMRKLIDDEISLEEQPLYGDDLLKNANSVNEILGGYQQTIVDNGITPEKRKAFLESNASKMLTTQYLKKADADYMKRYKELGGKSASRSTLMNDPVLKGIVKEVASVKFANSKKFSNDGYIKGVYTGATSKFTEFNKFVQASNAFFASGKSVASDYGRNIMNIGLNLENPLYVDCRDVEFDAIPFEYYNGSFNSKHGVGVEMKPLPKYDSPVAYYNNKSAQYQNGIYDDNVRAYKNGARGQYPAWFNQRSGTDFYDSNIHDMLEGNKTSQLYLGIESNGNNKVTITVGDGDEFIAHEVHDLTDSLDFIRQNLGDTIALQFAYSSYHLSNFFNSAKRTHDIGMRRDLSVNSSIELSDNGTWVITDIDASENLYGKEKKIKEPFKQDTDSICQMAEAAGYDGVIFLNLYDGAGGSLGELAQYSSISDPENKISTAWFFPEQAKLLDAVTYDNKDNVILPSRRFDITNKDIRFSQDTSLFEAMMNGELTDDDRHNASYIKSFARQDERRMIDLAMIEATNVANKYGSELINEDGAPLTAIPNDITEGTYRLTSRYTPNAEVLFARDPYYATQKSVVDENSVLTDGEELPWTRNEYIRHARNAGCDCVVFSDGSVELIPENGAYSEVVYHGNEAIPSKMYAGIRYSVDTSAWNNAFQQYGAIEQGMNPRASDVRVPNQISDDKYVSKLVRSLMESNLIDDNTRQEIVDIMESSGFGLYARQSNDVLVDKAQNAIARVGGQSKALADLKAKIASGRNLSDIDVAVGNQLMAEMAQRNDMVGVLDLASDLATAATESGRAVQAWSLLKRATGVGAVFYMNKMIDHLNQQYKNRIDSGKMNRIAVDPVLMQNLMNAKNSIEVEKAEAEIIKAIAPQLPLNLMDALRNWRYFAMLANPTTHIRNIVGNVLMYGATGIKNVVATGIETAAQKAGLITQSERTHALASKRTNADAHNLAEQIWLNDARDAVMRTGKFNPQELLSNAARLSHFSSIEKMERANSNALEYEDEWFLRMNFVSAFENFVKARGLNASAMSPSQISEATDLAIQEALRATYRDASALATWLNKGRKIPGVGLFVEGIMPFTKTPVNIAKRSIEYSPAGIIKGIYQLCEKQRSGKYTSSQVIDSFAQGFTGSALFVIGAFLAKAGILRAKGDDEEKAEEFLNNTGTLQYSVNVGDRSIDFSFAAPTSVPLFMGAALVESVNGDIDIGDLIDITGNSIDPLMEMSFLSSVNSALQQYGNGVGGAIGAVIESTVQSYIGQFFPTIGGKFANIIDPTIRSGKGDITSPIGSNWDSFVRSSIVKKIPGLTYVLEPSVDIKGEERKQFYNFGSWIRAAGNSFVLPGKVSVSSRERTDEILYSLYEQTGRTDIFPTLPGTKYLTSKGVRYNLNASQYTDYCEDYGTDAYIAVKAVMASPSYANATDAGKCDLIQKALDDAHKSTREKWLEKMGAYDAPKTK